MPDSKFYLLYNVVNRTRHKTHVMNVGHFQGYPFKVAPNSLQNANLIRVDLALKHWDCGFKATA